VAVAAWLFPDPLRTIPLILFPSPYLERFLNQSNFILAAYAASAVFILGLVYTIISRYLAKRRLRRYVYRLASGNRELRADGKTLIVGVVDQSYERTEAFARRVFFDLIPWWDMIIELKATIRFQYYIDLTEDCWDFNRIGNIVEIQMPPIRPIIPPTIIPGVERNARGGGKAKKAFENLSIMEARINSDLNGIANNLVNDRDVREICKKGMEAFLREWMQQESLLPRSIRLNIKIFGE
jgi:hypothetical protein